jgi:hypothetical protein
VEGERAGGRSVCKLACWGRDFSRGLLQVFWVVGLVCGWAGVWLKCDMVLTMYKARHC